MARGTHQGWLVCARGLRQSKMVQEAVAQSDDAHMPAVTRSAQMIPLSRSVWHVVAQRVWQTLLDSPFATRRPDV